MYPERLARLRQIMAGAGLDAVALNPGTMLTYLTGLRLHLMERPVTAIFALEGDPLLVLPGLEAAKAQTVPYPLRVITYTDDPATWEGAFRSLGQASGLDGKRVGVEPGRMRVLELRFLEAGLPRAKFISAQEALARLRIHKDAEEIGRMRQAVRIAQQAFSETVATARVAMSEREFAAELTLQLFRAGSDTELPFAPIVAGGPNGANPHATPGERKFTPGDLVVVDWGAGWQDYFSDLTRALAIGPLDSESARIAQVTREANQAGRAAAKPGIPIGEVDRAARAVIEAAGYGDYFFHRVGHGLGMEAHEEPYAFGGNPLLLEPGMTFTVEPGIYLTGRAGVRIEDNIVITATGCDTLSDLPREPFVIE
jgi:Xaa-Pro dipeptidase